MKCKILQEWIQRNLLVGHSKRLREKHSQIFLSFINFRCISSAIQSVNLPSLAVKGGTIGMFCVIATANVSCYRLNMYCMYMCAYIPIHAHIHMRMHIYTHTHQRILFLVWQGRSYSTFIVNCRTSYGERLKDCIHLSDPEIFIKA